MGLLQKIRALLKRRKLSPVTRAVVKDRLTYLSADKLERIEQALRETENIPGDILEFGVALGGSGIIFAHHATDDHRFHGLDVFGMIPPPTSEKDDAKSRERYNVIQSGASKGINGDEYYGYKKDLITEVKSSFARHGVPVNDRTILLHKGPFEETWPAVSIDSISLAHIDCDWYEPVRFCLHACADKLSPGGILIIDDYHDYGGSRTAVDEFMAHRPGFTFEDGPNPFLRRNSSLPS